MKTLSYNEKFHFDCFVDFSNVDEIRGNLVKNNIPYTNNIPLETDNKMKFTVGCTLSSFGIVKVIFQNKILVP